MVGTVVRHVPRVVEVEHRAQHAVAVFDLLQTAVLVQDALDELHGHGQALVLRQTQRLVPFCIDRHAERQVGLLLGRTRHHLQRCEEPEHAKGNPQFGGKGLVEPVAQFVGCLPDGKTLYLLVVTVQNLHHTARRNGDRLKTITDPRIHVDFFCFYCHGFIISINRNRMRPTIFQVF